MAEFELKKDWPVVAAVALGIIGLIMLSQRRGLQPQIVGGGTPAGFEEAIAAQSQVAQASIAAKAGGFQTLVSEFGATERTRLEAEAYVKTAQIQAGLEAQKGAQNLFGTIVTGLFGLFSWETTARGEEYRRYAGGRMRLAYGR